MNRDQIIKALGCCFEMEYCRTCLAKDYCKGVDSLIYHTHSLIKELTEENERVKLEYAGFEAGVKHAVSFVKADTVQKMHNRVLQLFPCDKKFTTISRFTIDQIAKEMLGERYESTT